MILGNDKYVIVDNFLDDPDELIELSKNITYHASNIFSIIPGINVKRYMPGQNWVGYRSDPLYDINPKLTKNIIDKIFFGLYGNNVIYTYRVEMYLHFFPEAIENISSLWHQDIGSIYAGLIYLNNIAVNNAGTILEIDNAEFIVDNKFNRLLMYDANINHRPQNSFGTDINNSRLTLVFFINKLILEFITKTPCS